MALKSMTGYGRALIAEKGVQIVVEILSVNRKHLDINVNISRYLVRFDPEIRKILAAAIARGHVTVRITATFVEMSPLKINPNLALVKQLHKGWKEIAQAVGKGDQDIPLILFEKEGDLFNYEETAEMAELAPLIKKGVQEALKPFLAMRIEEGKILQHDIAQRIKYLASALDEIESQSEHSTTKYREKLITRLKELLPNLDTSDERLLKEFALIAEKADVAEEITRFRSHLKQFEEILQKDSESPGKTADFLLQELGREINTIGSKAADILIAKKVVEIKSELERIREQVQNVE